MAKLKDGLIRLPEDSERTVVAEVRIAKTRRRVFPAGDRSLDKKEKRKEWEKLMALTVMRRDFGPKKAVGIAIADNLLDPLRALARIEGCSVAVWIEKRILAGIDAVVKSAYFDPREMRYFLKMFYGVGVDASGRLVDAEPEPVDESDWREFEDEHTQTEDESEEELPDIPPVPDDLFPSFDATVLGSAIAARNPGDDDGN